MRGCRKKRDFKQKIHNYADGPTILRMFVVSLIIVELDQVRFFRGAALESFSRRTITI